MWKTYKKSIYGFRRWTLTQGPRGPFYRVHSSSSSVVLLGVQLLLSVMAIVLSNVIWSLLFPLLPPPFLLPKCAVLPKSQSCPLFLFAMSVSRLCWWTLHLTGVFWPPFCNLGSYVQDGSCHILITQRGAALNSDGTVHPDVPYSIKTDHSKNLPQVPGLLCPPAWASSPFPTPGQQPRDSVTVRPSMSCSVWKSSVLFSWPWNFYSSWPLASPFHGHALAVLSSPPLAWCHW